MDLFLIFLNESSMKFIFPLFSRSSADSSHALFRVLCISAAIETSIALSLRIALLIEPFQGGDLGKVNKSFFLKVRTGTVDLGIDKLFQRGR